MSRVLLFKFQRISLSRDAADKYKTALRHIGLVANKMQPKQKGQVGGGDCEVYDCKIYLRLVNLEIWALYFYTALSKHDYISV